MRGNTDTRDDWAHLRDRVMKRVDPWLKHIRPGFWYDLDMLALGAMRYLNEQHIRVPDQVSVIGYEDSSLSGYAIPALTSVNIHKELIGRKAAEFLLRRLQQADAEPARFVAPADLVIRDSVIPACRQTPLNEP